MKTGFGKRLSATLLAVCLTAAQLPAALGAGNGQGDIFRGEVEEPGGGKSSVKVTLQYQYSPSGGMAGINAHAPETVEFFLNEDGTTTPAAWPIPCYSAAGANEYHDHDHNNLEGFRVVLNAAPLNGFLKTPPTGNETAQELEDKLNRGDFDPDPEKMADTAAVTQAWIDARTFTTESGLVFQLVDRDGNAAQGSAALDGPKLILKNPGALTGQQEITMEVNYRRDNGTYTVKHWIPKEDVVVPDVGNAAHWKVQETQTLSGRIGAMTRAEAEFIQGYANRAISQQPIKADGSTVVDIFYTKDDTIRVIFDTSEATSGEIDRQALNITDEDHKTVDFSAIFPGRKDAPVKPGYVLAGWAFRDKTSGDLIPLETLTGLYDTQSNILTPDEAFLNRAQLQVSQETAGVNVLQFYPMWEPGTTSVRVVFWTEDLTGEDDVDVRNKDELTDLADLDVKTHYYPYAAGDEDAAYSNMGVETLTSVRTDTKLELDLNAEALVYTDGDGNQAVQPLTEWFAGLETMEIATSYQGEEALTDASQFYTLDGIRITQMDGTHRDAREGDTAAPNGTTVVNVYYTRNIYRLEFIYSTTKEEKPVVAVHTLGYANGNESEDAPANTQRELASEAELTKIPPRLVVTGKYGADLRDVWPYHRNLAVEIIQTDIGDENKSNTARFVSWTTTTGPYNAEAKRIGLGVTGSEPTIMGVYGSMSADIIPDPEQHLGQDTYNEQTGTHRLYAYWSQWTYNNFYRYNHCYEIPDVTREMLEGQDGLVKLVIDGQDDTPERRENVRNICYLLPADGDGDVLNIIRDYGFEDLKKVRYTEGMSINEIQIDDNGNYYGFRIYQDEESGKEKCYALARIVSVVSTNKVEAQTPSTRLHMRRINDIPDHSTAWQPTSGGYFKDTVVGSVDQPCELFFYYDRIPYQIIYSVGSAEGLKELGTKELYYGAKLSDFYNIELESGVSTDGNTDATKGKTNGEYAVSEDNPNGWELPAAGSGASDAAIAGTQPVCPDRNERGTVAWSFKGWAMDLAGTALLDDPDDWNGVASGDLHLYAQWEAPKYTVEFDWNGGHLAFGSEEDYQTQEISANSSIAGGGLAPVPVRPGYYLDHWRVTDYKLSEDAEWTPVKAEDYEFRFDQKISVSMKIQAVWKGIRGAEERTYVVHHELDGQPGMKVGKDQKVSGSFVPGFNVWASPIQLGEYEGKDYSDYIPTVQNAGVPVPRDGSGIAPITITYRPPTAADKYRYAVRFVEKSGGREVLKMELPAAEVTKTVYAGNYQEELDVKGYWLAGEDGLRADLGSDTLLADLSQDGEKTATFPVVAQIYEIAYQWPADMDEATQNASEKNLLKSYTPAKGATTLPTPGSYKQGDKTCYFKSWKLIRGTLNGESNVELDSVTIAPESRGALTFEAQWSDTPVKQPDRPSRPSGGSDPGTKPEDLLEREKHEAYIVGRSGGLVAPEEDITRAEVVTIFCRLLTEESRSRFATTQNPFPDVSSEDWFFTAATTLAKAGIVEGRPDGQFAPADTITRGEFAAMAARFLSKTYTGENHFSDVEGHWAAEYVDRAAQAGWIKGYPDGTFRPDDYITRAEAISLVNAVLGRAPHKEHLLDGMITWPDNMDEATWYYLDIQEATNSHKHTWQTVNGERVEVWTTLLEGERT